MEGSPAPPVVEPRSSFLSRHEFLIYRLFSLSGLMPIGGYLCIHLLTNATIFNPVVYQEQVDSIHRLGVLLPFVEWTFIFLPLIFHASVGWLIISGSHPNTNHYPYPGNIRYVLQRGTGIIAFFFILLHVLQMHQVIGDPFRFLGGAQFDPEHATSSAAGAIRSALWVQIVYLVGILSCVYHLANGLWTFGITWGIWETQAAQRRANYISAIFGIALAIVGLAALWFAVQTDVERARQIEDRLHQTRPSMADENPKSKISFQEPSGI